MEKQKELTNEQLNKVTGGTTVVGVHEENGLKNGKPDEDTLENLTDNKGADE